MAKTPKKKPDLDKMGKDLNGIIGHKIITISWKRLMWSLVILIFFFSSICVLGWYLYMQRDRMIKRILTIKTSITETIATGAKRTPYNIV